jgi:3-hydroxy acid dehydrogenase/malonic semialdehyde reductase
MLPHKPIANNLFGKTVLITGASSGIGRSTALEFARSSPQSLNLIVTARRVDRLYELAAQIKGEVGDGVKVCVKELDVSRPEEIEAMFGEQGLPDGFRDVDVLINNACVSH